MSSRASQLFESMSVSAEFVNTRPVASTAFSEGRDKGSRDFEAMMHAIEKAAEAVAGNDRRGAARWKGEAASIFQKMTGKSESLAFPEGTGKGSGAYEAMLQVIEKMADAVAKNDRKAYARWKKEAAELTRDVMGKSDETFLAEKVDAQQDFADADEMVEYIEANLPKALKSRGIVYVRKERGLGRHGVISVKYLSTDFRDDPRKYNIEHNAFYRLIFIMHHQPETPNPREKLRFNTLSGATHDNGERGLKSPRLMPQKTFRAAADKLIAWFKKNEKVLLDWPTHKDASEAAVWEARDFDGTATVFFQKEALAEVPVYKGDRRADIKMRALDHIRKHSPSKIMKALNRVVIKHKGKVLEAVDLTDMEELMLAKANASKQGTVTGQLVEGEGTLAGRVTTGADQFDSVKSLIEKGLIKRTNFTNEQGTERGLKVTFRQLHGMITEAGKAYFATGANESREAVSEARVGRFYPTTPELTRRQFIETMLGLVQELNIAAEQPKGSRDAVIAAMAKADQALMNWMLKEHKGMLARMHDADQVAYRAELRELEARLKQLRAARELSWDKMSEIILSAVELYGF